MVGCIAQHPIYTNYGAKEDGTILNLKTMRRLKPGLYDVGYLLIGVYKNGKPKTFYVHRFVYECFRGDILPELQVDHIENDKQNSCIDNLQLLTPAENSQKAPVGKRGVGRKLPISVVSICIETGKRQTFPSMSAASCAFGVHRGAISIILSDQISDQRGLFFYFNTTISHPEVCLADQIFLCILLVTQGLFFLLSYQQQTQVSFPIFEFLPFFRGKSKGT